MHAALLFAVVPWLPQPFSTPKLAVLAAGAAALGLLALRRGQALPRAPALLTCAWLTLLSLSALHAAAPSPRAVLLDGAAALLLLALLSLPVNIELSGRSMAMLGGALALIVLAQALGAGNRMRLYGTLGNPDFCAAWLGASACLTAAQRRFKLLGLQAAALAALGSFATILALAAGALAASAVLRSFKPLALAGLAAAALALTARRDPGPVIQGRVLLHRVALAHVAEAPVLGHGPGSVRALWPSWAAGPPQDHVHDDWLERALEQGIPAALCLAALAALAIARTAGTRDAGLAGAAAGAASLAARALVDFPLERPAELALFVTLLALCLRSPPCKDSR